MGPLGGALGGPATHLLSWVGGPFGIHDDGDGADANTCECFLCTRDSSQHFPRLPPPNPRKR